MMDAMDLILVEKMLNVRSLVPRVEEQPANAQQELLEIPLKNALVVSFQDLNHLCPGILTTSEATKIRFNRSHQNILAMT